MNKNNAIKVIGELSNANGAPGFEDEVIALVRGYCEGIGSITEDAMRNLYVCRNENNKNRPVVQLDAHTDEVGFIIQAVKPNGTLQFLTLGSWVPNSLPTQKLRIRTKSGVYITGCIASKPPHFLRQDERNAVLSIDQMVIDIGASSRKEAIEDYGVYVGAPAVPDVEFEFDEKHDLLKGKAFDCRIGCAALTQTLYELKGEQLGTDIIGAFSAQEEVGCRGAKVTAAVVKPDIAIVFEGCPADDTFTEEYAVQAALRRGPMLRHVDNQMITNPRFQRFALDIAEELNIPVQEGVRSGGGTNGSVIHVHSPAVPVIVIGIPVRYIHTHNGYAAYSDFENSVKLACEVIRRLNNDVRF